MGPRSPELDFVPYGDLDGAPNVVVDGASAPGTVLCLSHWPGTAGPAEFAADLSAQMAFLYLNAFDRHPGAVVVSNNHFDQDGLVSVFALARPEDALARRALLIEVARAGDFAVTDSRDAARISMVISAYAQPTRSPLQNLPEDYDDLTALLYDELLGRLATLCDHPDRYRAVWAEEDATLRASEAMIATGAVEIEEVPDVDLAVVTVPEGAPRGGGHRFGGRWVSGLHPMAVHNATERGALLIRRGQRYEFTYRYESWVQYRTRRVRPRVDLTPLSERLNAEEHDGAVWVAEPVSGLTPTLSISGDATSSTEVESSIDPERLVKLVESHLRVEPPAWDPYRVIG